MRSLRAILLFGFGLTLSLYYGRRGFMPLDQSIVFDGAWRILSGELPFRDYVAPNGFAVHALQALFFAVGGVNWFSYLLHAAVVNGLFVLVIDRILRLLGAGSLAAAAFAAASGLVLYPPVGAPLMESHAFFFSALGIWLALEGRHDRRPGPWRMSAWRTVPWLIIPWVMICAALSKQIPSAFVLPLVVAIAGVAPRSEGLRRLGLMAASAAIALATLIGAGLAAGIEPDLVSTYFFALPAAEAPRRLADAGFQLTTIWDEARSLGMISLASLQLALGVCLFGARHMPRPLWLLALAEGLIGVGLAFSAITINQKELGVAYVFLATGIATVALEQLRTSRGAGTMLRRSAAVTIAVVAVGAVWDAYRFHVDVNVTRSVNDIHWAGAPAPGENALPVALSFLQWQVPTVVPYDAVDLGEVAAFLAAQDRGFLLLGDASILYGLTGKPSAAPSLWFHPGLTLPPPGTSEMRAYEDWLLARIAERDVRFLVLEGRHTWNHFALADLPRVAEMVRTGTGRRLHFGGFRVVDLISGHVAPEDQEADESPSPETRSSRETSAADKRAPSAASDAAS